MDTDSNTTNRLDRLIEAALDAGDEYGAEVYARARAGDQDAMKEARDAWRDGLYD